MDLVDLATDDFQWCHSAIAASHGPAARIVAVTSLPARTSTLHRVDVEVADSRRVFYLKKHSSASSDGTFEQRARLLNEIASSLGRIQGLLPYSVVGYEPVRRLLLTAESRGNPIIQLQRRLTWSSTARRRALGAWHGVGVLLHTLHRDSIATAQSTVRAEQLVNYAAERFRRWRSQDPAHAMLSTQAEQALSVIQSLLSDQPLTLGPCHGDVSAGNILCGQGGVGLIDFDDFRFDMPGVDVSQALLELDQFWRIGSILSLGNLRRIAESEFRRGYGPQFTEGTEIWLPHLRNLSVIVVTLASRRHEGLLSKVSTKLHYARAVRELARTIAEVTGRATGAPRL